MCGRFAISHIPGFFSRFMIRDPEIEIQPRYNIAPTQDVPIIIARSPNRVVMMRWGLVPFWAKDPKIGNRLINARAETISTSPAFRSSVKKRRCLVPATGFYEWRKTSSSKIPYYCHLKGDSFFAFAGLYDRWKAPEGTDLLTFTIVTTVPNALVSKLHNRMPAMLRREDEDAWLRSGELQVPEMMRILRPYPAGPMEMYPVSHLVGDPRNESEEFVRPLASATR
jgi:putative SOS response-associated peptidase YedK